MSGEIQLNEEKKEEKNPKITKKVVFGLIIVLSLFGTILIGMIDGENQVGSVAVVKEPTSIDSKLQARQLEMRKKNIEEGKKRIKDTYLTDLGAENETTADKLLRRMKGAVKPKKDLSGKKPLYEVLNIEEKEVVSPEKKKVISQTPRRRSRRVNRYIETPQYKKPPSRYRNDDIFASEIGGKGVSSKYAGIIEEDQIGNQMNKLNGFMDKYMGQKDYSQRLKKGGEIEVVYNENPVTVLFEGDFLECVLKNKIKSDVAESPAIVEVARDFFDRSNKYVVIPKGTRVIGYSRPVNYNGAGRLFIFFRRMILPNGVSLNLQDKSIALDRYGINGVSSGVNRHFLLKYGSAFMVGLLDGLGGLAQNRLSQGSGVSYMLDEVFQNLNMTNREYLQEYKNVLPTIKVNPGSKILVYMSCDINISAYSRIDEMSYADEGYYE